MQSKKRAVVAAALATQPFSRTPPVPMLDLSFLGIKTCRQFPANSLPAGKKSNPGPSVDVARGKKRRLDQMLTHSFELFPAAPNRENFIPANRLSREMAGKGLGDRRLAPL